MEGEPKGQPSAEEECPQKERLGRGSEFTGEGGVAFHFKKEKLPGCAHQSRAAALGQAGTASARQATWARGAGMQRALVGTLLPVQGSDHIGSVTEGTKEMV